MCEIFSEIKTLVLELHTCSIYAMLPKGDMYGRWPGHLCHPQIPDAHVHWLYIPSPLLVNMQIQIAPFVSSKNRPSAKDAMLLSDRILHVLT